MEEKIICTHCDQPVDCGYELVNGQIVCSDCVSHYCCVCDRCGATIWDTDAFGNEYTNLCRSCYENYYVRCERCECLIHTDDAPYDNYYSCHEELLLEMCGFFGVSEEDVLTLLEYKNLSLHYPCRDKQKLLLI